MAPQLQLTEKITCKGQAGVNGRSVGLRPLCTAWPRAGLSDRRWVAYFSRTVTERIHVSGNSERRTPGMV